MTHEVPVSASDMPVLLTVLVSTGGDATTTVRLVLPDSSKLLATSPEPDGIITDKEIGNGNSLLNQTLKIKTIVELDLIPDGLRQSMIDNLVVKYTFTQGDNTTSFEYEDAEKRASSDKKLVIVIKNVKLV
ncbi:hypothetical protein [[Flexibacter] sp. ATCC 35208]|uniref:hypothetical protein n=1 Tax=[Flexibacter] sp. ATCC 35208 TaxID=1936242 RepID=UPI0009CBFF8F|nr:hypothetical protein [[Flexibacter] sp. ATCC 35208]OMP75141.1 hypothetical protein BW716_31760 [[Flexibacter] sp. ATCC 35208]